MTLLLGSLQLLYLTFYNYLIPALFVSLTFFMSLSLKEKKYYVDH